ncbi:hypothetical protein N8H71_01345 [Pseudomonas koreensis]|uniref:hypothetical protein n=1 Tax=Pseudomonas koreensis TaxID=198620 RepID=UPI0021CA4EE8|nr:hypothetical protein [Pseudomonas koreensis]MCU0070212.1 hypothetical protein [Pseudomonas koreensis]
MEYALAGEMFWSAAFVIFGIPLFYLLFCWLFVWESRFSPRRLGDIGWKRVDYYWIIAGSTGLVFQFIQFGLESKLSNVRVEESYFRLSAQSLNIAAQALSDPSICLGAIAQGTADLSKEAAQELANACRLFEMIRPSDPVSTRVDNKIYMNYNSVFPQAETIENPFVVERIKRFKQAYSDHEEQARSTQSTKYSATIYEKYLKLLKIPAAILLVAAIALRLAKVKGEIRLKTHHIEK